MSITTLILFLNIVLSLLSPVKANPVDTLKYEQALSDAYYGYKIYDSFTCLLVPKIVGFALYLELLGLPDFV